MLNEALNRDYEIIEGVKFMSPAANLFHNRTLFRLGMILGQYTIEKKCGYVFTDSIDVYLPDGNLFKPDLTVVKSDNTSILNWKGAIRGVPDMVVEVLSKSTKKKDLTVKKNIYEKNGVKEYWIIDPFMKVVDVYILRDGKFEFDDEYFKYDADELDTLTDEEKAEEKPDIKVSIFDDLFVKVDDIFSWGYDD